MLPTKGGSRYVPPPRPAHHRLVADPDRPARCRKSHLAASTRPTGTLWLLDTEGAASTLRGKPGIHPQLQVVQTLSLRQLLDAMRVIKQQGQPGDTVILDSVSKVLQAMRAYAQQRAGADTNKKASLAYDEHASVNRTMQAIYTGLTELKQAGFHVLIIGHLAKKYQTNGSALADAGLRVLADDAISYEADAVLLVERSGDTRTITPIMKPPRPAHLQLNRAYPATLATLYPDQAAPASPTTTSAPKTAHEAEQRFFARYGAEIGGTTWAHVEAFLGYAGDPPTTVQDWVDLAAEVRRRSTAVTSAR